MPFHECVNIEKVDPLSPPSDANVGSKRQSLIKYWDWPADVNNDNGKHPRKHTPDANSLAKRKELFSYWDWPAASHDDDLQSLTTQEPTSFALQQPLNDHILGTANIIKNLMNTAEERISHQYRKARVERANSKPLVKQNMDYQVKYFAAVSSSREANQQHEAIVGQHVRASPTSSNNPETKQVMGWRASKSSERQGIFNHFHSVTEL